MTDALKKMKVKNLTQSPQMVHAAGGSRIVNPGQTIEADFSEGEAAGIEANLSVFATGDRIVNTDPAAAAQRSRDDTALRTERDNLRQQLMDLAGMFGSDVKPDEVKDRVTKLLADVGGNGGNGGEKTLPDALASLDDADDAHWTQAGKPSLDHLTGFMGRPVTRAEVDAIKDSRVRKA